jgi:hypothetical protein
MFVDDQRQGIDVRTPNLRPILLAMITSMRWLDAASDSISRRSASLIL